MKKTILHYLPAGLKMPFLWLFLMLLSFCSRAQYRNYGIAFSDNLKGGVTIFGNTLMNLLNADGTVNIAGMNGNSVNGYSNYDNGGFGLAFMQYVDIDGVTGYGAGTRNSSSADLILPPGNNTIRFARVYWGGRALKSDFDMTDSSNQTIKIRKGSSGSYQEFSAAQLDRAVVYPGQDSEYCFYQAFADITDLVQQNGGGTYTVGNAAFSRGFGGDFGNYGAWSIVIVYENPTVPFSSVRVYDGFQQIYDNRNATETSIALTGLNVPAAALVSKDAQIGMVTWEGDSKYGGDYLKINGHVFGNAVNPPANTWNGTISINGEFVNTKNPNYTDQMGIDIDQFYVGTGYGILPNDTAVTLELGTVEDQYFCGLITFMVKMKDPTVTMAKSVADENNNGTAEPGEKLTYTLKGTNIGFSNANDVTVTDTLPAAVTYLPNSLKINYGPGEISGLKTDRSGDDVAEYNAVTNTVTFRLGYNATGTNGGFMEPGDSFEIAFQVIVNVPGNHLEAPFTNVARVVAVSDAGAHFVDEGSAEIYIHFPPILPDKDIHIPNAFTPNGDNLNDTWKIPLLIYYPLAEVTIFNRYGQVVFHDKNNTKQWDGKMNGKDQPVGAYVYRIDFKNGGKIKGGTLMLIR